MTVELDFEQKLKYWEQLRNAIVHEDNLVNHRLTWLLTIEGFLIGSFFVVQSAVLSNKLTTIAILGIEILLIIIFFGVAWICYISGSSLVAAFQQIAFIRGAWLKTYPSEKMSPSKTFLPEDDKALPERPKWFWNEVLLQKQPALNSSSSSTSTEDTVQFPPIMGLFRHTKYMTATRIPFILFTINVFVILACMGIIWGVTTGRMEQQKMKIELEKTDLSSKLKVNLELDRSQQDLLDKVLEDIKSIIKPQPTPQGKQP